MYLGLIKVLGLKYTKIVALQNKRIVRGKTGLRSPFSSHDRAFPGLPLWISLKQMKADEV